MINSSNSQPVQPRKRKSPWQAFRGMRQRLRNTRAALAVPEVHEGNTDADWELWEDSVIAFDTLFQSTKDQLAQGDAFASVYQER